MKFLKYESNGNDFIIGEFLPLSVERLCNRNLGVGADGFLYVNDNSCSIYNSDGSEAMFCGNGSLCLAHYLSNKYDKEEGTIRFVNSSIKWKKIDEKYYVKVPAPYQLFRDGNVFTINVGNKHLIKIVDEIDVSALKKMGKKHKDYNVSFVSISDKICIRTYERGVGLTSSCGSAAISAYYCMKNLGYELPRYDIISPGGISTILYINGKAYLEGKPHNVYEGEIYGEEKCITKPISGN